MAKILRLPGLTDIHVHFRDPGQTHKEDFYSGTSSALAGGITTVFDMPNNLTPVFTQEVLQNKINIAKQRAVCDWGLYFGTNGQNTAEFEKVAEKVVGLKLYLSLTTGKYVVADEELVQKIFRSWPQNKVLVVHAEGDRIDLAIKMCQQYANKVHITHVTKKIDLEKIISAKKDKLPITCDVTPHHLFLTHDTSGVFEGLSRGVETGMYFVKPPLASQKDQDFLWENINWVDCIATDHGPHTIEEKQSENPPYGVPGLETMLPLLLTAASEGRTTHQEIIRLTSENPRKIFGLPKDNSTYIEIDPDEEYIIDNSHLLTKCRWSPFHGWSVKGRVKKVVIRDKTAYESGRVRILPGFGKNITVIR